VSGVEEKFAEIEGRVFAPETSLTVDESIGEILGLLGKAAALAAALGRHDWVRKMEQLQGQVSGKPQTRRSSAPPAPLAPVGPPVNIDAWLDEVMTSLRRFREVYTQAHEDQPDQWPIERPAEEWFEEWGQQAPAPKAEE
jgi:hypothetical protein